MITKGFDNMPDSFFDWLNACPVQWVRQDVDEDSVSYLFYAPEPDTDEEE